MPVIHGVDVGGRVKAIPLDANGQLIVSINSIAGGNVSILADSSGRLIVVFPQPYFTNPLGVMASVTNTALGAGSNTITVYTVPTAQRAILKWMTYRYTGTVAGVVLTARINRGGTTLELSRETGIANNELFKVAPDIILDAADVIELVISGATANDDINVDVFLNRIE